MQSHNAYPDPSYSSPAAYNNGAAAALAGSAEPYIHPTIPLGLPHVVQFVEASIHHLPMSVRFVGDRLSRYANAKGEVSMAASFLCRITGLGSRNTADHHLRLIESLGVLEKKPGQGGKDRKSNTYVFQGEDRNWKPLPTERPGTDPWVALARSRRENEALRGEIEELQAELARLMNGATIAHPELSNGPETAPPQDASHSYETADSGGSPEEAGPIAHPELSNGPETAPPQEASHSYETAGPVRSSEESGPIAHSELSNGPDTIPPQEASHSYETADSGGSPELSNGESEAIAHPELSNGPDTGQQYLARRGRVEALVMEHRGYYDRRFRGGVLSAVHHFSLNSENEDDLLRQVNVLRAGQEPSPSGAGAAQGAERAPPREEPLTESGRREVEYCPDCGSPYTTFNGEERCPDCTGRRRRESEA